MQQKGKKFLSDLKLYSDYFKWNEKENRYETWEEACASIVDGHKIKYADYVEELTPYLNSVYESLVSKSVLASQRNLQYRYPEIEKSNARIYNCVSSHVMRNRFFQEAFYLGLCGCGVGASLLIPFVKHLSKIKKRVNGTKTYVIQDSIIGWADALGVLLSSYFIDNQPFPEFAGSKIRFDYSQIRPKGSLISGGFKAPGHEGLKHSLENIEKLLDNWIDNEGEVIRPILAFDIICFSADSVLSGGIRRSALNMLVDPNDEEMIMAKTGNWRQENPQRARSNNSVLILRKNVDKEYFKKIVNLNDGDNDIGFAFVNSWFDTYNPCITGDMKILLSDGYFEIASLDENKEYQFITPTGNVVSGYIKKTGMKKTVSIKLSTGKVLKSTPEHIWMTADLQEVEAKDLVGKKLYNFNKSCINFDSEYVKYGFLQGDGGLGRLKSERHKGLEIFLNEKDNEIAELFGIETKTRQYINGYNDILISLGFSSEQLPSRTLPSTISLWNNIEIKSFLRGLYSANGSFIKAGRIALKSTCKELVEDVSKLLVKFGIKCYITTNKPKNVTFNNGTYLCKESYDLNIANYDGILSFMNNIGFVQSYKTNAVENYLNAKSPKVVSVKQNKGLEVVYDFELDDMIHYGVVEGFGIHNCFEISKLPVLVETDFSKIHYDEIYDFTTNNYDKFGWQKCNLCEINAEVATTKEKFLKFCKDASVLGTLQAGYTSFPYLGEITEKIVQREALLGVSITGWMNNPKLFNPELLKEGANLVKKTNKEIAKIIGINPAARTTTVKPSGNASVILGTASGIHPDHSERFFRIMQLNKETNTAKWLKENMEFLLEESVWSATNSDYVVFVPIENPKNGLFKKDMYGIKHLELIKLVQENWVREGTDRELSVYDDIHHNVSSTVIIDNKEEMIDYILENKHIFNAVSFLSNYGDKDFNQAPFTSVLSLEELVESYGKAVVFASGLIVDGLHYFDNNLWLACDLVMDNDERNPIIGTREQVLLRKYWIKRAKKFAKNYFGGDVKKMVYCLKDVHLFHKWENINREFRVVDFSKILSKPEYKEISEYGALSCSGGACEITKI